MNKKVELKRFPDINSAYDLINCLKENEYSYYIEDKSSGYNLGMATDIMDNQVVVWVNESEFDAIMAHNKIKNLIIEDVSDHYLYTLSDQDILETINNPSENTFEEFELAKKIARDRGLEYSREPIENSNPLAAINETENSETAFPPKPVEEVKTNSIRRSITSLVLFIGVFHLVFHWDLTYIIVLAGVLLIHEIGHFLAMKAFNYTDLGILFIPLFGASASGSKDSVSQKQNVVILLAGPVPGVIIGLILYYFGLRDQNEFLIRTSNIFILLNLFNLLPVMPLDGGKLIKSMFFENNEIINKIFILLSIALMTYFSLSTESYFMMIIPFLLLTQLGNLSQLKKVRESVLNKSIDINKSYEQLTDQEYWMIRDEIGKQLNYFKRIITPGLYAVSEYEQRVINQVKAVLQKIPKKDLGIGGKVFITLLWIMTFIVPLFIIAIYFFRLGIFEKI